jgi:hypothetical protein
VRKLIALPVAVALLSLSSIVTGAHPALANSSGSVTVIQVSCHYSGSGGAGGAVVFIDNNGTTMTVGGASPNIGMCFGG